MIATKTMMAKKGSDRKSDDERENGGKIEKWDVANKKSGVITPIHTNPKPFQKNIFKFHKQFFFIIQWKLYNLQAKTTVKTVVNFLRSDDLHPWSLLLKNCNRTHAMLWKNILRVWRNSC